MYPNRRPFGFELGIFRRILISKGQIQGAPFYIVLFLALYYSVHNLSVPEQ